MGGESEARKSRVVILDRDGVINRESPEFIKTADEWHPLPNSLAAIAMLTAGGYRVYVATNQSGVARGLITPANLERIHDRLRRESAAAGGRIDGIYSCPHGPDDGCSCRKPQPGLLLEIAAELGRSLEGVPVIGDSARDLQAARAVGARPILVRTGNGAATEAAMRPGDRTEVHDDLWAVAKMLTAKD